MEDDDSAMFGRDDDDGMDLDKDDDDNDNQSIFNGSTSDSESGKGSLKEAREDLKLMNIVRAMVILFLLTVSVIAAESVYIVTLRAQETEFQQAYLHASETLIASFYETVSHKLWVAQSLATDLSLSVPYSSSSSSSSSSSAAVAPADSATAVVAAQQAELEAVPEPQETWPFVTFYGFEKRCKGPMHLSHASTIALVPIVRQANRQAWEAYAAQEFMLHTTVNGSMTVPSDSALYYPSLRTMTQGIYNFADGVSYTTPYTDDFFMPHWQQSPSFHIGNHSTTESTLLTGGTLFNAFSDVTRHAGILAMVTRDGAVLSTVQYQDANGTDFVNYTTPRTTMYYPLHSHVHGVKGDIAASISLEFLWADFFKDILQDYPNQPLQLVLENQCRANETFLFQVNGIESVFVKRQNASNAQLRQQGYFFVEAYTPIASSYATFAEIFTEHGVQPISADASGCNYQIHLYATTDFRWAYVNNSAEIFRAVTLLIFISVIMVFVCYDCLVGYRQRRVVIAAERSDAIVSSLFPSKVRDRLYENAKKREMEGKKVKKNQWTSAEDLEGKGVLIHTAKTRLKDIVAGASGGGDVNEPIADLFKETTILFADLAGFTAWSSEREPTQVFTLLEAIYKDMDRAAKKLSVFKVETVGDCYVAATGIPEYQENHVEIMARFARTCLIRTGVLTKQLEQTLGPGTAELAMRIGIHSGSVTAGVLRSQKARFQLFGDTMNYASRMESTGTKNKIHLSSETAHRLIKAGRQHWVVKREELTHVKGKGDVQTYWLHLGASSLSQTSTSQASGDDSTPAVDQPQPLVSPRENKKRPQPRASWVGTNLDGLLGVTEINESLERLVKWNVDVLIPLLKNVVAYRIASGTSATSAAFSGESGTTNSGGKVLDDVQLFIDLPKFNASVLAKAANETVELIPEIKSELHEYVMAIASGYKMNAFHNFEHASHVILSASKLLKRIMAADDWTTSGQQSLNMTSKDLHEHTYGIGTDPLTQFAVVFSALIHDVGHEGVPNARLVIEQPETADRYQNKCIAEQQSVDIAWELLLLPKFKNLRACIYRTKDEYQRFRHLVANSVIATDIFDKELKVLRQTRWDRAFGQADIVSGKEQKEVTDTKATVVIEHVIQASDVSHCMQHWYIYQKWNERLFKEMYAAYRAGRAPNNPAASWYQGEMWFFDNYVIPLAKKLNSCGVFGVSSDEYLTYALQNRREWEIKGESVVKAMEERAIEEEENARRHAAHTMESVEEEASTGSGETSSLSNAAGVLRGAQR